MNQDELKAELTYWKETAKYWEELAQNWKDIAHNYYYKNKSLRKTLDKEKAK